MAPSITTTNGDKEGLGLVILEAMASGLPVVASNSGGIPEIVTDKVNGFLTEEKNTEQLAEKINILLKNPELRKSMADNGIKTAESRSYKVLAERYFNLINKSMS